MSARDSAAPGRGQGSLANGGVGGGFGGGAPGGGVGGGRNGGYGGQTGLTTGNKMPGNSAFGRAGGMAQAYGMRDAASLKAAGMGPSMGSYGNFKNPDGSPMFAGSPVQDMMFRGPNMGAALGAAQVQQAAYEAANRPQVGGLLDPAGPQPSIGPAVTPTIEDVPLPPNPTTLPQIGMPVAPDFLQRAVATPRRAVNIAGGLNPSQPQQPQTYNFNSGFANSAYSNPSLGTPAPGGSGLGKYNSYSQGTAAGGKGDLRGPAGGSVGTWR